MKSTIGMVSTSRLPLVATAAACPRISCLSSSCCSISRVTRAASRVSAALANAMALLGPGSPLVEGGVNVKVGVQGSGSATAFPLPFASTRDELALAASPPYRARYRLTAPLTSLGVGMYGGV